MKPLEYDFELEILTFPDTELALYRAGNSHEKVVLVNGLGGGFPSWIPLIENMNFQFISWDYRGFGKSFPKTDDFSISAHAKDMKRVIDKVKGKVWVFAWSMGVAVSLEYISRWGVSKLKGLVFISGVDCDFGRALLHRFPLAKNLLSSKFVESFLLSQKVAGPAVKKLSNLLVLLGQRLGITNALSDHTHKISFVVWKWFEDINPKAFAQTLFDYLNWCWHGGTKTSLPLLFVWGARDFFIPETFFISSARKLARFFKLKTRYFAQGTHYIPLEFPNVLSAEIKNFICTTQKIIS